MLLALLLAGCAGDGANTVNGNNFGKVTLRPGASAQCIGTPCDVYFEMPPGTGMHLVTGNELKLGEYPSGKTVYLGGFDSGQIAVKVVGSDAPIAYVTIGGMD